ncbi:MAG: ParB N-terminal domain-containing protein [Actinobacteria bacterium]|nr:ParB N-terminal domain-containing protein [Actinomycetota bacterium]MCB0920285.1 ParB N-terminal domain-containing protein [Actinomycetota bacterium]HRY08350.1 ParB N-terminal domain-containing protein [Candidatus Nanopelagicales bacterium]
MRAEHGAATAANGGDRNGGAEASVTATDDNDGQAAPYQLLPPLSETEYAALRESIHEHGVRVPIEVDENGNILDGHHRAAIAAELGIDCPQVVVSNLDTETDKRTVALMLNLSRRHLTREQVRSVIAASITADPQLSDREHARRCGCSPTTVGTVRKALEVSELDTSMSRAEAEQRLARIQVWLDQMGEHLRVITEMLTYCGVPQTVADEMVSQVDRDVRGMVCAGPPFDQGLELIARRFDDLLDLVPGLAAGVR